MCKSQDTGAGMIEFQQCILHQTTDFSIAWCKVSTESMRLQASRKFLGLLFTWFGLLELV